jgi:transcriptional regulator with XRE-family HTH domain
MIIGERLRDVRHAQHLSLTDVAGRAGISAATLSRIETSKQDLDVGLLLTLARILKSAPHELLGSDADTPASDPLVTKIAALGSGERTRLWRDLATARRDRRKRPWSELSAHYEELLAHFEYIRQEIESVRANLRRR